MARNTRVMRVRPDTVWRVLADGSCYADWVVGTRLIRDVDASWPKPGARLHYTVSRGPLRHDGFTEVRSMDEGQRIELRADAWPFGRIGIEIRVEAAADGARVTIDEAPVSGPLAFAHNPVGDLLLKARNVETLRRLEQVAAGQR